MGHLFSGFDISRTAPITVCNAGTNNVDLTGDVASVGGGRFHLMTFVSSAGRVGGTALVNGHVCAGNRNVTSEVGSLNIGALLISPLGDRLFHRGATVVSTFLSINVGVLVVPTTRR